MSSERHTELHIELQVHMVRQVPTVRQGHMDLPAHTVRQVHMDPQVHMDHFLTHGSFRRCVGIDGSALKLEFRKRHLVTSDAGCPLAFFCILKRTKWKSTV